MKKTSRDVKQGGIKLVSWSGTSGYALAALDYLRGLVAEHIPVYWVPLCDGATGVQPWTPALGMEALNFFPAFAGDSAHADLPQLLAQCCQPRDYDTVLVHLPPEYWPVYFEPGRHNIGFTAWETDRLPPHWTSLLNLADRVLVPSQMNRDVMQRGGVVVPVDVIPHMLRAVPPPAAPDRRVQCRAALGIGPDTTVFYSINTWEPRKGNYDLLRAFAQAFSAADDVLLILKPSLRGIGPPPSFAIEPVAALLQKWRQRAAQQRNDGLPAIRLIDGNLSGTQIEELHCGGDISVSLTRGEGWGMSACEALARGRPVLMTGFGGQLDYLGADWPWLVNYRMTQVTPWPNQSSFLASQRWAQADIGNAAQLMRQLHHDLPAAMALAAPATAALAERLSMQRVTQQLLESLNA
ncbi:MAG: glycosyltransferase family 4 protein [Pseudomonadota bacterium]